jgi:signal transduction histidine kinase
MCAYEDIGGETTPQEKSTRQFLRRFLLFMAALVILIGAFSIFGWATNNLLIDSIFTNYVPIALSTSIFIFILASILMVCAIRKAHPLLKRVAFIAVTAVLVLCIWIFLPITPDPEDLLDPSHSIIGGYSVRASPIAMIALILSSADFMMILSGLYMRSKYVLFSSTVLSLSVLSIGVFSTIGYLYGNPLFYEYGEPIRPIALLASLALIFLGLGALLSKGPGYWPLSSFTGTSVKARLLRILLPITIGIILIEGYILAVLLPESANPVIYASTIALITAIFMGLVISRVTRWVGEDIDSTHRELVNLGEELRRANEKLKVLDSITRHDTINQLTILMGRLGILKSSVADKEILQRIDELLITAGSIEATIKFSREYQNIGSSAPIWIDVRQAMENSMKVIRIPESISVRIDVGGAEVLADAMFEKVLVNLLDNSLRYGENLKNMRMSHEIRADDALILIFEDDGVGISEEDKSKLFTRGFGKHTGLGLYQSAEPPARERDSRSASLMTSTE